MPNKEPRFQDHVDEVLTAYRKTFDVIRAGYPGTPETPLDEETIGHISNQAAEITKLIVESWD